MTAASKLSDADLVARSSDAGRILTILAVLPTLCMILFVALAIMDQFASGHLGLAAWPLPAIATVLWTIGLWMLATAARRGNAAAVGVVMAVAAGMLLFSVATLLLLMARNTEQRSLWHGNC